MQNNNPSPPPTTRYIYDAAGHRTSRTDPNGHTITYAYDQVGRLTATTDPLGRQTTYRWDAEGHLVLATMPGSGDSATRGIALSYDILGREVGEDMGNGATIYAYNYDANNRLTSLADPAGLRTQAYDPAGQGVRAANNSAR